MELWNTAPPVILGYEDEAETLLNRLVGGPKELDIVPIVGMSGLGKTTLATKLYSHETVIQHYDVRSWCCITQVYDRKEVLLKIWRGLGMLNTAKKENDHTELADELRNFLKGKRYLIVVDDLWSVDAWDDLRTIFPDDNKGSRLVLITRLDEVACYASTNPHHLRNLTEDESWELLKKIVFEDQERCPDELEVIGNEIATSCSGLPLAIVLISGLLTRREKEEDYWKEIALNLSTNLFHDVKWLMEVIELSYNDLPHHLRPCFLYFGTFSEDAQIPVHKLIQSWICEGFIPYNELKSMDHVATDYLMDLVGRNLVMFAKTSYYLRRPQLIGVHDLLHQFCMVKATEEIHLRRFRESQTYNYDHYPQFATDMPSRLLVDHSDDFIKCEGIHSLRFTYYTCLNSTKLFEDSFEAFKLLTVLDLEKVNVGNSFPYRIVFLICLRYLEISGDFEEIPLDISCLVNLETMIVHSNPIEVCTKLPNTIWDLFNLRHLEVYGWFPDFDEISQLEKLRNCYGFLIYLSRDMPIIANGLSNVVNLKCTIGDLDYDSDDDEDDAYDWDDSRFCEPIFQSLDRLESLSFKIDTQCAPLRRAIGFPSSLKRLELLLFPFGEPLRSLSTIGELPNLEIFNIYSCFFYTSKWDVKDGEFPKLKVLKIFLMDDIEWNVSANAFPSLQQICLSYCRNLEIPSSFGCLNSLNLLDVHCCCKYSTEGDNRTTEESAMKIKEIQIEEMANFDFKLIISENDERDDYLLTF
ncbi:putative late blight resistance protein homolog R1C-3 [Nicotiana tomentosiformis]|uniref:putative late blight resistance protein homolog R1C-3 n=1 Tax=Nicotiana tomentosiformis TaxID=4098 RepID=UPI00051B432A|nr:putative late blight resistance protein homolog R1C-3 [Nicotiana tomentosiformis]